MMISFLQISLLSTVWYEYVIAVSVHTNKKENKFIETERELYLHLIRFLNATYQRFY
jgi:hypothetical protein